MLVESSDLLEGDYEGFGAGSEDAAEQRVLADLERAASAASWAV